MARRIAHHFGVVVEISRFRGGLLAHLPAVKRGIPKRNGLVRVYVLMVMFRLHMVLPCDVGARSAAPPSCFVLLSHAFCGLCALYRIITTLYRTIHFNALYGIILLIKKSLTAIFHFHRKI